MTPHEQIQAAHEDHDARVLGLYNHELYARLEELAERRKPLVESWNRADRVALLQVCFNLYEPASPEQANAFMEGFQLANAHAARYGAIPEGHGHA